jgi:hypothetical protein
MVFVDFYYQWFQGWNPREYVGRKSASAFRRSRRAPMPRFRRTRASGGEIGWRKALRFSALRRIVIWEGGNVASASEAWFFVTGGWTIIAASTC